MGFRFCIPNENGFRGALKVCLIASAERENIYMWARAPQNHKPQRIYFNILFIFIHHLNPFKLAALEGRAF